MIDLEVRMEDLHLDPWAELEEAGQHVMRDLVSDMRRSIPAKVKKATKQHYEVRNDEFEKTKRGFHSTGEFSGYYEFTGQPQDAQKYLKGPKKEPGRRAARTMAPAEHFQAHRSGALGSVVQVHQPMPYGLTFKVKGGGTTSPGKLFVQNGIPMARAGADPYPTRHVYTMAVPSMIGGEAYDDVEAAVSEYAEQRLEHHMNRYFK